MCDSSHNLDTHSLVVYPTGAFCQTGGRPRQIADFLGQRGIFVWDGNHYALAVMEKLGLEQEGGMLRIGLVHYNIWAEIDRLAEALNDLARIRGAG